MDRRAANELLCDCLCAQPDERTVQRLAQLSPRDWQDIAPIVAGHGVAPLLYHRLRALGPNAGIPSDVLQELRTAYHGNVVRNMRLYHELGLVLTALRDAGIPVILLKGAHLAEGIYGDIGLRSMTDVDMLVKRPDLMRAGEKLLEMDYMPSRELWSELANTARHHLPPFTKADAAKIEVHWLLLGQLGPSKRAIVSPFRIDIDELWERAQPAVIADKQVLVLSPGDLLLHLCVHTFYHHRFLVGVKGCCDIAETIRYYKGEIDWKRVQARAQQWGAGNCVYLTLYLARELLKADVPDEVLDGLVPGDWKPQFVTWAKEQIFTVPEQVKGQGNLPEMHNLARVREAQGVWGKVVTFLKIVFPPKEIMAIIYPVTLSPWRIYLYYPVRWKDLFLKYGRVVWQLLRRDERLVTVTERESRINALLEWIKPV